MKKSIKAGRTIAQGGGTYELHISPTGNKKKGTAVHKYNTAGKEIRGVPLYAPKMEEKYGYMKAGYNIGMAGAKAAFEEAYRTAFAKFAP